MSRSAQPKNVFTVVENRRPARRPRRLPLHRHFVRFAPADPRFLLVRYTIAIIVTSALVLSLAANVAAKPPPRTVDLNSATVAELVTLPGIGGARALDIVTYRQRHAFRRPSDLMKVRGIGRKIYLKVKPYVRVGEPPASPAPSGG